MSEAAGGGGGADTELKTKTPHVNVGKKANNWEVHFAKNHTFRRLFIF